MASSSFDDARLVRAIGYWAQQRCEESEERGGQGSSLDEIREYLLFLERSMRETSGNCEWPIIYLALRETVFELRDLRNAGHSEALDHTSDFLDHARLQVDVEEILRLNSFALSLQRIAALHLLISQDGPSLRSRNPRSLYQDSRSRGHHYEFATTPTSADHLSSWAARRRRTHFSLHDASERDLEPRRIARDYDDVAGPIPSIRQLLDHILALRARRRSFEYDFMPRQDIDYNWDMEERDMNHNDLPDYAAAFLPATQGPISSSEKDEPITFCPPLARGPVVDPAAGYWPHRSAGISDDSRRSSMGCEELIITRQRAMTHHQNPASQPSEVMSGSDDSNFNEVIRKRSRNFLVDPRLVHTAPCANKLGILRQTPDTKHRAQRRTDSGGNRLDTLQTRSRIHSRSLSLQICSDCKETANRGTGQRTYRCTIHQASLETEPEHGFQTKPPSASHDISLPPYSDLKYEPVNEPQNAFGHRRTASPTLGSEKDIKNAANNVKYKPDSTIRRPCSSSDIDRPAHHLKNGRPLRLFSDVSPTPSGSSESTVVGTTWSSPAENGMMDVNAKLRSYLPEIVTAVQCHRFRELASEELVHACSLPLPSKPFQDVSNLYTALSDHGYDSSWSLSESLEDDTGPDVTWTRGSLQDLASALYENPIDVCDQLDILTTIDQKHWCYQFTCSRGNEYFCEIDEDYLTDRFNLTNLNTEVQYYQYALDLVTDVFDLECDDDMREQIEKSARHLYGLIHARYIVTTRGLQKMLEKYKKGDFGKCPRVSCDSQALLPVGQHDVANTSAVKLYCARCEDIYNPKSSRHAAIDGAYFGTSFHGIFFQVYAALVPPKSSRRYEPKIYGFKVHAAATLARWQDYERDDMKRRLRDEAGLEQHGFEQEDEEDEEDEEDDEDGTNAAAEGIDDMFEGRRVYRT